MIHYLNKILITLLCIILYFKFVKKEGFTHINQITPLSANVNGKIPNVPSDVIQLLLELFGLGKNPHNPLYTYDEDDETCSA